MLGLEKGKGGRLTLHHEARNDAVKDTALVCKRLPIPPHPMLPSAELPEILCSRCHHILVQLEHYPPPLVIPKWSYVKVHPWPARAWCFLHSQWEVGPLRG